MRRGFLAVSALVLMSGPLAAQTGPLPSWNGFYGGGSIGFAWGPDSTVRTAGTPGPCNLGFPGCASTPSYSTLSALGSTFNTSLRNQGGAGGGQVGYNVEFGSFVVGVEADITGFFSNNKGTTFSGLIPSPAFPAFPLPQSANVSRSLDYVGTGRGRIGYLVLPNVMLFATGGVAYGDTKVTVGITQTSAQPGVVSDATPVVGKHSSVEVGYTVGGGVEWMLSPGWSVKADYSYYDLGRVRSQLPTITSIGLAGSAVPGGVFSSSTARVSTRFDGSIVKAGLNYHFNFDGF